MLQLKKKKLISVTPPKVAYHVLKNDIATTRAARKHKVSYTQGQVGSSLALTFSRCSQLQVFHICPDHATCGQKHFF